MAIKGDNNGKDRSVYVGNVRHLFKPTPTPSELFVQNKQFIQVRSTEHKCTRVQDLSLCLSWCRPYVLVHLRISPSCLLLSACVSVSCFCLCESLYVCMRVCVC